ncbi:hypothetical protein BH10ACI3_BH10ACI3_05840 [soil metagenome]
MLRILSTLFAVSLIALTIAPPAYGQTAQTDQQIKTAKIKTKVQQAGTGEKAKLKVKLNNDASYQGYVKQANDEDFVIVDKTVTPTTIKYADVNSVGGKGLSTGAKIGIGIAIGAGATVAILFAIVASLD